MTDKVVARRMANALIPDAEVALAGPARRIADLVLQPFRSVYGGLWVGGVAELRPDAITVTPNSPNRVVHDGVLDLAVPLREVTAVAVEHGFVTRIIAVAMGPEVVRIRCWRADEFAEQIRAATRATGTELP